MICEKCGSNNPKNSAVCTKCGTKMPTTEVCGGFADILSYEGPVSSAANSSGVDDKTIQKLERKVNAAIDTGRKLTILSFISLTLSLVVLVCFIFTSCNFAGCFSCSSKGEPGTQTEGNTPTTPDSEPVDFNEASDLPEFFDEKIDDINQPDLTPGGTPGTNTQ